MLRYLLMFGMCLSTQVFGSAENANKVNLVDSAVDLSYAEKRSSHEGEEGPRGRKGAPGPRGERGHSGLIGPQGINGLNGENGEDGGVGPQGPTGKSIKGHHGPKGATGATGATGITGSTGSTGHAAEGTGPTGPDGIAPGFIQAAYSASLTGPTATINPGDAVTFGHVDFSGDGSITPTTGPVSIITLPKSASFYLVTYGIAIAPVTVIPALFELVLTDPPTGPVSVPGGALSIFLTVGNLDSITTLVSVKDLDPSQSATLKVINSGLAPTELGGLLNPDTTAYINIIKLN